MLIAVECWSAFVIEFIWTDLILTHTQTFVSSSYKTKKYSFDGCTKVAQRAKLSQRLCMLLLVAVSKLDPLAGLSVNQYIKR